MSDKAEVFKAACRVHQLMGRNLDRDREAVGEGFAIDTPIVHQCHLDFVEHDGDAAAVEVFGQVPDGEPNAGGFHGVYSVCSPSLKALSVMRFRSSA